MVCQLCFDVSLRDSIISLLVCSKRSTTNHIKKLLLKYCQQTIAQHVLQTCGLNWSAKVASYNPLILDTPVPRVKNLQCQYWHKSRCNSVTSATANFS